MLNKLLAFTLTLGCLGCAYGATKLWLPAGANAAGVVFHINQDPLHPQTSSETSVTTWVYGYRDGGCDGGDAQFTTAQGGQTFSVNTLATANGHSLYLILSKLFPPTSVTGIMVKPKYNTDIGGAGVFGGNKCVPVICTTDPNTCYATNSGTAGNPVVVTLNPNPNPPLATR